MKQLWKIVSHVAEAYAERAEERRCRDILAETMRIVTAWSDLAGWTWGSSRREDLPEMIRDMSRDLSYWKDQAQLNAAECERAERFARSWKQSARKWRKKASRPKGSSTRTLLVEAQEKKDE